MLAKALRNQELVPLHIPESSDEAVRDFLRMVDDMRKDVKRHKQRLLQFEQENHQWVFRGWGQYRLSPG